jgi:hypothetical protein
LQERAPGDVDGQLLDRDAGLHAADIRLGEEKLVEGVSCDDDRVIF